MSDILKVDKAVVDAAFGNRITDVCKGDWLIYHIANFYYDYWANCQRCGDVIYGRAQVKMLVIPGYHCWCDR